MMESRPFAPSHTDRFREMTSSTFGVLPLVSILIRTHRRTHWLREALQSVADQTYPNIEAIVVEDGPPLSQEMVEAEFRRKMNVRYVSTGGHVGRARVGNVALAEARGEWLNFLDDDDVLFVDHVEAMLGEAQRRGLAGVYGLALEAPTRILSDSPLRYEEIEAFTRFREEFDRIALWHHHYMPIQAVMFHRSLFEECGGFDDEMDQLEDWNLWTRYTLRHDFALVHKTTSKYRVPADREAATARLIALDNAYADALARQRKMVLQVSPALVAEWVQRHAAHRPLGSPARQPASRVRQLAERYALTHRLICILRPLVRRYRRLRASLGEH